MIKSLQLRNFRNHRDLKMDFEKQNYIEGLNGSGKSSILEAIYYVSLLKSFRTSDDKNLINNDAQFAKMIITTNDDKYEVVLSEEGKFLKFNNKVVTKMSDFIGGFKVVMFSLEDLEIIKGLPKTRRSFMDIEMVQIDSGYLNDLSTYRQVLKRRNDLLKQIKKGGDLTFLNIVSKRLALEADVIIKRRTEFVKKLNGSFKESFKRLNQKDEVSVIYKPDVALNSLESVLNQETERDLLTKTTNKGPHRDDFVLTFNGELAKTKASAGEQRLMIVALKLALLELIKEDEVIVLLDDVLSELDNNVKKMIESILKEDKQVIITGTESNYFPIKGIYLERKDENGNKQKQL